MAAANSNQRCAHAGCTCHVQGDAKYCSDTCAASAVSNARQKKEGCECGHAECTTVAVPLTPVGPFTS